jgi:hypothetical protein
MTHYGIIGSGNCPQNIIEDGLRDLGIEGNTYYALGRKNMSPNEERVFDYLIENEATYAVVHDSPVPKGVTTNAFASLESDNALVHMLTILKKEDGMLLVLWDEEEPLRMEQVCFAASDYGVAARELTNGLAPITVANADVKSKEIPVSSHTSNTTTEVSVSYNVPNSSERSAMTTSDDECVVNVVMPNGTIITTQATIEEVRSILGLG